jgi:hypothetical protein
MKISQLIWVTLLCVSLSSFAQSIPNSGFETWVNPNGYNVPDGWSTFNDATNSLNIFTCVKGIPGSPGASYIKLTSKSVPGLGVVPGMAVAGAVDLSQTSTLGGFAYTDTPTSLNGKWQYMASGADMGYISVTFTKWNSGMNMREVVGEGYVDLEGMEMSWANFSIPITFTSSEAPDTCSITLSASGDNPVANSYLYVDNLGFMGTTSVSESSNLLDTQIYPNPFENELTVRTADPLNNGPISVSIINGLGQVVFQEVQMLSAFKTITTQDFEAGIYYLKVVTKTGQSINKLMKL